MRSIFLSMLLFLSVNVVYAQTVMVRASSISVENGRHYLDMSVANCTGLDITVPLANLPWGQYNPGLVLYRAGKLAGNSLKEDLPIGDVPVKAVVVPANSEIHGRVDLDYRFSALSDGSNRRNLVLFWVYDLSLISGGPSRFVGGMVPLVADGAPDVATPKGACGHW